MKHFKRQLVFIIFLVSLTIMAKASAENVNDYFIVQEGHQQTVPVYNGVIRLKYLPFSIQFYTKKYDWDAKKPYTTKIAVLLSKNKWDKVESGGKVEDSAYFEGGSAFAIARDYRYNALFFSDMDDDYLGGSHNMRYGEKKENKTADLLKQTGDYFKLTFDVNTLFIDSRMIKIEDSEIQNLFFMIFSDRNLDGIIDEDELIKFIIHFD